MKYRIVRENRPTLKNYGRYKAVAVHEQTVETPQIVREVCRSIGASRGTVIAVLIGLAESIGDHLRRGDRVRLDDWGLLKLEIECAKVDAPADFRPDDHIRGARLHFLPESRHGRQALYHGLRFDDVALKEPPKAPEITAPAPAPQPDSPAQQPDAFLPYSSHWWQSYLNKVVTNEEFGRINANRPEIKAIRGRTRKFKNRDYANINTPHNI